ncbi:hypothetical protein PHYSODRAFT_247725 [Phytophthora sojae]|uniref:Phosphoribosyltransferase domain-containing protein n=1 Tax=Phytophthora sojae (strain P6497) TaxID=1094619 RepID=G4Z169_PHYSP|nr:hypothetical protein PHYSODRAFT_247725 [Phytophthora sojae]EGZ24688.1 hypothetical protein PHYSODRAFT_247725 [Phytophthora sojae]|eukprot:XP_009519976.1 hypothetical protein PHYSODRAFT_247725 [Phytophthora sojae]
MGSQELAKEMEAKHPSLYVLNSRALQPLLTKIRDRATTHMQFKHYSDRLMRILAEEGLASCASTTTTVVTPTGDSVTGVAPAESMYLSIRAAGKILIQRDESSEDKHAVMYYSKLPPNVATFKNVLVVDPMLGTGGSITMAIKGLDALFAAHPDVKVVTAGVDRGLNNAKYLTPGIGDFGDRYFNTVHSHHP